MGAQRFFNKPEDTIVRPWLSSTLLSFFLLTSLCFGPALKAKAEAASDQRATVGQEAPAIDLPDSEGSQRLSVDLKGKKNLVLVFFRGAW